MVVGVCILTLSIPESHSLKEKRRVIRSLLERLRHRYNLAAAEVESHDIWNQAVLGLSCVSVSDAHAREILDQAIEFASRDPGEAEVIDQSVEILHGF